MPELDDKTWRDLARRLGIEELKFYARYMVGLPIVSSAGSAFIAYLTGLSSITTLLIAAVVAAAVPMILGIYVLRRLLPLRRWTECTKITDLTGFERINQESAFMPSKILERQHIGILQVMGNGCSKWTMPVGDTKAINAFKQIRNGGGKVYFLASCPIQLSKQKGDQTKIKKARKNAISLLKLRSFAEQSKSAGGTFEIKTYKHVATLRLIILNETECIIGHYQEDGNADSLDTPLLIFHHNHENKWGFGGAFKRMFESEWHRAAEPTLQEWEEMKKLRDKPE